MQPKKSQWLSISLLLALTFAALHMWRLAAENSDVRAKNSSQELMLEQATLKHLADLEECVALAQKRMEDLSIKWREKFDNREKEVIKEDAALLQLHGDLMVVSAVFLSQKMKLPMIRDLEREAWTLADDTLSNRFITFDDLIEQKWLKSRGENPVSALHYENKQF